MLRLHAKWMHGYSLFGEPCPDLCCLCCIFDLKGSLQFRSIIDSLPDILLVCACLGGSRLLHRRVSSAEKDILSQTRRLGGRELRLPYGASGEYGALAKRGGRDVRLLEGDRNQGFL